MISTIVYDSDEKELNELLTAVKDGIAKRTEGESRIYPCDTERELTAVIEKLDLDDFSFSEFTQERGEAVMAKIRRKFPKSPLLIVVDESISPAKYIRPSIMPTSVILRPMGNNEARQTIGEFLDTCIAHEKSSDDNILVLETKSGVTKIPYSEILLLEASAKKVYVRLRSEEYGCSTTLDNFEKLLPENFARCHRGYIVNIRHAKKFSATENVLYLIDGSIVPVSRSYKGEIRNLMVKG